MSLFIAAVPTFKISRLFMAIGLSLTVVLTGTVSAFAAEPANQKSVARYEVRFLEKMIDHHAMAVMMAQLCEDKAVHNDLKEMCSQMEEDQQAEITLMQSWLSDWYGITYQPAMQHNEMHRHERLAEKSGEEFETTFIAMMIRHHKQAVRMSDRCLDRAEHEPLQDTCQEIKTKQQSEISQMKTWLCQWYDKCPAGTV